MDYAKLVNATDRSHNLTFADRAVVPRWVRGELSCTKGTRYAPKRILDFGGGKARTHARSLMRDFDVEVDVLETGSNVTPEHIVEAQDMAYDIVYASNVLNVQPDTSWVTSVLMSLYHATKRGGCAVFNFPRDPRKNDLSNAEFESLVTNLFYGCGWTKGSGGVYVVEV